MFRGHFKLYILEVQIENVVGGGWSLEFCGDKGCNSCWVGQDEAYHPRFRPFNPWQRRCMIS